MARRSKPHQHHNGSWRFRFQGREYWAPSESLAWKKLAELQAGAESVEGTKPISIVGLIERWEAEHGGTWQSSLLNRFDQFCGALALADVDRDLLVRYHRQLQKDGLKPATVRHYLRQAAAVLRYAATHGWLAKMPEVPLLQKPMRRPRALAAGEIRSLIMSLGKSPRTKWVEPLVRLLLETGMRLSEARLLEWSAVDLPRRVIVLTQHKTAKQVGKVRIVQLTPAAVALLEQLPRLNERWVFVSHTGQPYSRDGLAAILKRRGVSQYQLRHTFAQHAIDSGVPPELVTKMLGHESSEMVWMYARIKDERVQAAASALASTVQAALQPEDRTPPAASPRHGKRSRSAPGKRSKRPPRSASGNARPA